MNDRNIIHFFSSFFQTTCHYAKILYNYWLYSPTLYIIYCDSFVTRNVYLSLFPYPFPSGNHQSYFVSMTMFLFSYTCSFVFVFLIPHISQIIKYLSFSLWLISLSVIASRSILASTNGKVSFFLCLYCILCVCVSHLLYPLSISGHLGCFHISPIVNNAAVNMGVHIPFWSTLFISFR